MRFSTLWMTVLLALFLISSLWAGEVVQSQTVQDSAESLKTYIGEELIVVDSQFITSPAMKYVQSLAISDSTIMSEHDASLKEILSTDGGIYVKSGQLPLKVSTPMLNGGSLSHQSFLLDGLPVAFPQLQEYDMNYQPLWSIGKIEIIPGSHSGLYGSGGMAGVINLHTQSNFGKGAFTRVEIASGDYDYDWLAVRMKHHFFKRVGMYVSGTRFTTAGAETDDGTRSENLSAKIAVAIADGWSTEMYAQSHLGWLDYHWFGALCHQFDDAAIGALHINGELGAMKIRTSAQLEKYDQKYESGGYEFRHQGNVITGDLRGTFTIGAFEPTIFSQVKNYDLNSTASGEHNPTTFAAGAQTDAKFGKISAMASARIDKEISGSTLPSFGGAARYDFSQKFFGAITAGTGFRTPNPNEMWYYDAATYNYPVVDSAGDTTGWTSSTYITQGNPDLQNEKSTNIALTTGYDTPRYDIGISGFATFYKNLITSPWTGNTSSSTDSSYTSTTFPENIDAATIAGATMKCSAKPMDWLSAAISYTLISATDSSGEKLPERPDAYLSASLGFDYGIWNDDLKFKLRIEPTYTGKIARLKYNETTWTTELVDMPSVFLLGGRASIRLSLIHI